MDRQRRFPVIPHSLQACWQPVESHGVDVSLPYASFSAIKKRTSATRDFFTQNKHDSINQDTTDFFSQTPLVRRDEMKDDYVYCGQSRPSEPNIQRAVTRPVKKLATVARPTSATPTMFHQPIQQVMHGAVLDKHMMHTFMHVPMTVPQPLIARAEPGLPEEMGNALLPPLWERDFCQHTRDISYWQDREVAQKCNRFNLGIWGTSF
jgi:hypothetical protein